MSLNYTPLRHKMLAAIADGKVRTKPGQGWRFEVAHAGQAHMARTCGDLWDWTAQHGEPSL